MHLKLSLIQIKKYLDGFIYISKCINDMFDSDISLITFKDISKQIWRYPLIEFEIIVSRYKFI